MKKKIWGLGKNRNGETLGASPLNLRLKQRKHEAGKIMSIKKLLVAILFLVGPIYPTVVFAGVESAAQTIYTGTQQAGYEANKSFDDVFTTGCSISGTGDISNGQDFGVGNEKNISVLRIQRNSGGATQSWTGKFQYSDDNSVWYDTNVTSISIPYNNGPGFVEYQVYDYGAHRYWRVLKTSGSALQFTECEMEARSTPPPSPDGNLVVNGSICVGATNPYSYKLYVSGAAFSTGGWVQPSDLRFKENIISIESPLNKVLKMEGVSFNWRTEEIKGKGFPEGRHYGVIAQEVQKVIPEAVKQGPDGEAAVSYTEIIPILIEAVKEQQKLIESQQREIEELKATFQR